MRYLITGITGTLGQAVTKRLLEDEANEVIGVSRDEQKQRAMPKHARLKLYLGDVRDQWRILELCEGVDVVFHFAALKCVDSLEANPEECLKTNILGTRNVLFAQKACGISRVVLSSTDKAAYPINIYGQSKAAAEKLVLENPNNVVCRYGNVVASRGSVIPMFANSLRAEKRVYITSPEMTRFLIRIEDAAQFVIDGSRGVMGGLKIPEMKSTDIMTLADAVADVIGVQSAGYVHIGMRPGEKLHECLRTQYEGEQIHSHEAPRFTMDELKDLIRPVLEAM